jgi:hypothetical protein
MIAAFIALVQTPIALKRQFEPGLKSAYKVEANLHVERRMIGLVTFLPQDVTISYGFTTLVESVQAGVGKIRYERPTVSVYEGDWNDQPAHTDVEKVHQVENISLSEINEVVDHKSLGKKQEDGARALARLKAGLNRQADSIITPFIEDMERNSLFIGPVDSSMDFAPRLDFQPVKVGDTWKRTVGFQPQKLKGKKGKALVQRIDLTYTYAGTGTLGGKPTVKVQAALDYTADLGDYLNGVVGASSDVTEISTIPVTLHCKLEFDLDPKTLQTLRGTCNSEGGFSIRVTKQLEPVVEEKLKGETVMTLVGRRQTKPQ